MELSDKIRIIRKARGLSQEALGESLSRVSKDGISRQSVSDWENGKSEPKLDNIRDLAHVLNVSFDALLDERVDLNDQKVLSSVLSNSATTFQNEQAIINKFKYNLYASTISVKSFRDVFISVVLVLLTILFGCLSYYCDWGVIWIIIITVGGGILSLIFIELSIIDLIRIAKGRECVRIGEINNTYLILYAYKDVGNTLYIPIEQIEKMELGKEQKKMCGEVLIFVAGKSRPITAKNVIAPKKLVETFERIANENGEDKL